MSPLDVGPHHRDWIGLTFILLVAVFVRVETIGYNHFRADEAALAQLAQGIVIGSGTPTLGILSSVGIPNSPISDYMIAAAFPLGISPLIATVLIAIWNPFGVGCCGGCGKTF